jgi:acyl-[acyl-carrier-protein] desaturase
MTTFDFHQRQVGTSEKSTVARRDRATEDALYRLYRGYFETAENTRNWNPWVAIPWDEVKTTPSAQLAGGVLATYKELLFLPDYSAHALSTLRASRGRAWFLTRWSYEEGKHLLALGEWLVRSGVCTDEQLKTLGDEILLQYRWESPTEEPTALFVDALLWEVREIALVTGLQELAQTEGDTALIQLLERLHKDNTAHQGFFRETLRIISQTYPEEVTTAITQIAKVHDLTEKAVRDTVFAEQTN